MLHTCQRETVTFLQLGSLDTSEVEQVLWRANELQHAFYFDFDFYKRRLPLDEKYKLPNGGYDLCGAVEALFKTRKYKNLPRPLIIISAEPLGDTDHPIEPDYFYFCSQDDDDPKVTIMSTQPLSYLPKNRTLENYLFMMLSNYILSTYGNVSYHKISRGCMLDYCDDLSDAENCLRAGELCPDCEVELQKRKPNQISFEQVAAALRFFNRAAGRKYCFVMMPFNNTFDPVYEVIRQALTEIGWKVKRADEIAYPRLITNLILKEILTSDLVIADLTNFNPNVFYEVGLTHSLGNDLLLLTQEEKNPFDLANEHTIFYSLRELEKLKKAIQRSAGSGLTQSNYL
jgi:hypothetical protein